MSIKEKVLTSGQIRYVVKTKVRGKEISRTFNDYIEAREFLESAHNTITIEDVASSYYKTAALAPATVATESKKLESNVYPFFGRVHVASIEPTHIIKWHQFLKKKGLHPQTIYHCDSILRRIFKHAVIAGVIQQTPFKDIARPRVRATKRGCALTQEQVVALLNAAYAYKPKDPKDVMHFIRPVFRLAVETGARPEEYLALGPEHLQVFNSTPAILFERALVRIGFSANYLLEPLKTDKSRRLITITPDLYEELINHIKHLHTFFEHPRFLFPSYQNTPVYYKAFLRAFNAIKTLANLPRSIRPYDLRHTHATMLLAQGISPHVVAERLGHSSVRLTLETYAHVLPAQRTEATRTISAMLVGVKRQLD